MREQIARTVSIQVDGGPIWSYPSFMAKPLTTSALCWNRNKRAWNLTTYTSECGSVRVSRCRKSHSSTVYDGCFAIGRRSRTTTWSEITVSREFAAANGIDGIFRLADRVSIEGATHMSIDEAKHAAASILSGARALECRMAYTDAEGNTRKCWTLAA